MNKIILYNLSICFIAAVYLSSCTKKIDTNEASESGLSALDIKTPTEIQEKVSNVKLVATSSVDGCTVVYPEGSSTDISDISKTSPVSSSSSSIKLTFYNKCFPYTIDLVYTCKDDPNKICYKGTAPAKLENKTEDGKVKVSMSVKEVKDDNKGEDKDSKTPDKESKFPPGISHVNIKVSIKD